MLTICTEDKIFLADKEEAHSPVSTVTALELHSWVWMAPNSHSFKAIMYNTLAHINLPTSTFLFALIKLAPPVSMPH